ncbi:Cation transport regulator-like protein 2 [Rhizophlyctis rosea]|nr:Cation transport regulator-like protein 2 [Rhizophlyctis rosea]
MWVFGYGSLIWKIDFPYEKRVPGYIKGYVRRFWQGSTDHRGTHTSPGRVVTLIPTHEYLSTHHPLDPHPSPSPHICWGIAYKIPDSQAESVRAHLDHREKNGYEVFEEDVYHPDYEGGEVPIVRGALVYVATSTNESFLGPDSEERVVRQILESRGPSGRNVDYFPLLIIIYLSHQTDLLGLTRSMQILAPSHPDTHLQSLERSILSLLPSPSRSSHPTIQTTTTHTPLPSSHTTLYTTTTTSVEPGSIADADLEALRELVAMDVATLAGELAGAGEVGARVGGVVKCGGAVVVAVGEAGVGEEEKGEEGGVVEDGGKVGSE